MYLDELRDYCLTFDETTEDQPFGPDHLVFRIRNRIFAIVDLDGVSVNLKCDPERALELRQEHPEDIKPGYHMNKRHWNTVVLRGSLPDHLIRQLLSHSYELVKGKGKTTRGGGPRGGSGGEGERTSALGKKRKSPPK
jgi:predicted DNA-binding protein (MmcQ/YjbR family)